MSDLKKYKEAWQNQSIDNTLDSKSLNKMIHKKSSSIVKWIFYISIMEFGLVFILNVFIKTDWEQYKEYGLYEFMVFITVMGYVLTLAFIYLFYKNYKNISVTESTKDLMKNILNTRKTVKYYIFINIIVISISLVYSFYVILHNEEYEILMDQIGKNGHLIVWGIVILAILFVIGLLLGFYLLIYGILIKKLNQNYKELTE